MKWLRRRRPAPETPGRHRIEDRRPRSAESVAASAARAAADRQLVAARALAATATTVAQAHAAIDRTNHIGELFAKAWGGRT